MKLARPACALVYGVIVVSILYKVLDVSGLHGLLERKLESTYARVMTHIDWGYSWIFKPVFLYSFIFPFVVVLFLYSSAIFLHLYKRRHEIKDFIEKSSAHADKFDWARLFLADRANLTFFVQQRFCHEVISVNGECAVVGNKQSRTSRRNFIETLMRV